MNNTTNMCVKQEKRNLRAQLKEQKRQEKIAKLDEKWKRDFGLTYTEAILNKKNNTKTKHHFLYYTFYAFKQIKASKKIFFLLVALQIIGATASFFVPVFTEKLISAIEVGNYDAMVSYGVFATLCVLCSAMLGYYLFENLNLKTVRSLGHSLARTLVNKLLVTKQQKYNEIGSGEIINKSQHASTWFVERLGIAIGDFAYIMRDFGICAYLAYLDIRLLGILFICGAISSAITIYCSMKYTKNYDRLHEKVSDKLYNTFGEIVRGSSDIKSLNNQQAFVNKIKEHQSYQKNADVKNTNTWLLWEGVFSNIFYFGCQIVFFIVAAILLKEQSVAISVIIVCMMNKNDVLLLFENVGHWITKVNKCEVMAERIYNIMDESTYPSETFGNKHLDNFAGNIEFVDVKFSYNGENNVLDGTNFKINAGEKVAFVGLSGGGKSTIINLIPKLLEKSGGKILLDGIDIDELDKDSIRNNISLVSQTPYIFNGTIKENLMLASGNATEEDAICALKQAQLYDFIASKPDGIQTVIGEGGIMLSGGQRQRLAIARALLRKSKILLLDEATSALDNKTQNDIKQTIDNLSNQTIIIVAHRLSTVIDCDRIMLLDKGQVVAQGTHKQLMQNNKEYRKLYKTEESNKEGE